MRLYSYRACNIMHVHPFFPYWPFDRIHVGSRQFYSRFKLSQNLSVNLSVLTNRQNLSVVGLSVHVS